MAILTFLTGLLFLFWKENLLSTVTLPKLPVFCLCCRLLPFWSIWRDEICYGNSWSVSSFVAASTFLLLDKNFCSSSYFRRDFSDALTLCLEVLTDWATECLSISLVGGSLSDITSSWISSSVGWAKDLLSSALLTMEDLNCFCCLNAKRSEFEDESMKLEMCAIGGIPLSFLRT